MTPGVDFFRVDRSAFTRRILSVAIVLVLIGMTCIGAHLVHRVNPELGHLVTLVGGVTTLVGLVTGFGTMGLMLFENVYLAIKEDGLLVHENGKEDVIAWDALASAKAADGFVVLARKSGVSVRFHAGASASDVARRVEDAARKAAHGLLKVEPS